MFSNQTKFFVYFRGIAVGIYTTNSSEACYHCANYTKANIIVVQDQKQLDKILAIKSRLPDLKAIVQYEGEPTSPDVLSVSRTQLLFSFVHALDSSSGPSF